jgi:hypothetical protein
MTMPQESLHDLINAIIDFTSARRKFTLREWQRLAGWVNWSLNVFPLLRPALNNFYAKISGKSAPSRYVRINNAVRADLAWAVNHLQNDTGIHLIHQIRWDIASADFTIYCDACLKAWGFGCLTNMSVSIAPVPEGTQLKSRFFISRRYASSQLSTTLSQKLSVQPPASPRSVDLYTDNDNTVAIFNTLRCLTSVQLHPNRAPLTSSINVRPRFECAYTSQESSTTSPMPFPADTSRLAQAVRSWILPYPLFHPLDLPLGAAQKMISSSNVRARQPF